MLIILFTLLASVGRWSVSALFLPESGTPDPVSEKSAWKALTSAHIDKMNHIFEKQCSSSWQLKWWKYWGGNHEYKL